MPAGAAEPGVGIATVFFHGVEQVDDGRVAVDLASGQTLIEQRDAAAVHLVMRPAHGGRDALGDARQRGIRPGPRGVRETIGHAAPDFAHRGRERKLRHNHRTVGDVVQLRLKLNPWMVVIENHLPPQRTAADEGALDLHHRGQRTGAHGELGRGRAGIRQAITFGPFHHGVARADGLLGALGNDDVGGAAQDFAVGGFQLQTQQRAGGGINAHPIVPRLDHGRQRDGLGRSGRFGGGLETTRAHRRQVELTEDFVAAGERLTF